MKLTCDKLSEIAKTEIHTDMFGDRFMPYCTLYDGIILREFICKGKNCRYFSKMYVEKPV